MPENIGSNSQIIRNPENYAEMVKKLEEQEKRGLKGVLNRHKVSDNTAAPSSVSPNLLGIAKRAVEARATRDLNAGHRTDPTTTRQPVARDVITDSMDPAVKALQEQLKREISKSQSAASQAQVTHPPREL